MDTPGGQRILVIEDELPMRTALKDCLEAEGYRVLTAAEGQTGLQRALEERPDLVLLDIMMPRLDGYAVCAELRRLASPVPVLMLTAKGRGANGFCAATSLAREEAAPPDGQGIRHAAADDGNAGRTGFARTFS